MEAAIISAYSRCEAGASVAGSSKRVPRCLRLMQESDMATNKDVTSYTLKQVVAAKVDDHVEIAVEAEDGTKFKIVATSEQLEALTGDLETILDADDAEAEAAE